MAARKTVLFVAFLAVAFVAACRKDGAGESAKVSLPAGVYYGEGTESITNLPPDAVLLRVNGEPFTHRDFDLDQALYANLMGFLRSGEIGGDERELQKLKMIRAPKVLNTVLRRELLNQEARRRNVKASEKAVAARRRALEAVLSAKTPVSIDDLVGKLGDDCGRYLLESLQKEAENLELSWLLAAERVMVSEEEVTTGSNRLARANELVAATNAVLGARLEKALARINAGEDFAAVGSELSMFEKGEAKEWGTFAIDDFDATDYPDVPGFLSKMPEPGTVGGPFQCDDGVSIVKVLDVQKDEDAAEGLDEEEMAEAMRFKLARISVETFEKHPALSRDEIRKILEDDKRQKFEAEFGKALFEAAVIEFPSGTNLFTVAEASGPEGDNLKQRQVTTHQGKGAADDE